MIDDRRVLGGRPQRRTIAEVIVILDTPNRTLIARKTCVGVLFVFVQGCCRYFSFKTPAFYFVTYFKVNKCSRIQSLVNNRADGRPGTRRNTFYYLPLFNCAIVMTVTIRKATPSTLDEYQ